MTSPEPPTDLAWLDPCGECSTGHCGTCYARWGDRYWCPCPCRWLETEGNE